MRVIKNVALLLLATYAASCAGLTARQEALLPAMQLAWPEIAIDISHGIEDGVVIHRLTSSQADDLLSQKNQMEAAIASGNAAAMAVVDWDSLAAEANFGIMTRVSAHEISSAASESLKERLRNFTEARSVFMERR